MYDVLDRVERHKKSKYQVAAKMKKSVYIHKV